MNKRETNSSLPIHPSKPQLRCLSHILRNSAAVLEGSIELIEDEKYVIDAQTLLEFLRGPYRELKKVIGALEMGSFCALSLDECEWVSNHVGCDPKTRPALRVRALLQKRP